VHHAIQEYDLPFEAHPTQVWPTFENGKGEEREKKEEKERREKGRGERRRPLTIGVSESTTVRD
jgi:hypothetical protein